MAQTKVNDKEAAPRFETRVPAVCVLATLLAGAALSGEQLVVPGRAGGGGNGNDVPVRLVPTAHPPVPGELASMCLAPAQGARLSPALANFVRGVRLLEEEDKPAAALPLVSDRALATTPRSQFNLCRPSLALFVTAR
jgi:hypothetical protein